MACIELKRCKALSIGATYKIYVNDSAVKEYDIIIMNTGTGRTEFVKKTSSTATVNGLNLSFVTFTYAEFGEFFNSNSDFSILLVETDSDSIEDNKELYLMQDSNDDDIYGFGIIVEFNIIRTPADIINASDITTQILSIC